MVLNGTLVSAKPEAEHLSLQVGQPGAIELTPLSFNTDPVSRCQGIGVPLGYGGSYQGPPQSALVRFKTSVPSDTTLEWRGPDESTWKRVINPEPSADHFYLLTDLQNGTTYQVRVNCRSADGRAGHRQMDYTHAEPE